jgi:1-acyl-sn-glycerol-3-phosphate acyltransferase
MAEWYHRASWKLLKGLYSNSLLERNSVEASGVGGLPDPPFVLMSDHANALDPYVLGSFSRSPIRFMANVEGVHPLKAAFAELVGAYGRRKGAGDIAALRETFELSLSGDAIGIFPEGDRSWDGSSAPIKPGVGKLLKRLGVPLILARQKGNYLSRPRWASHARRGAWSVEFLVYDADELGRMPGALVEAIVSASVSKNEIKDAASEGRRFECDRSAEGIGLLLWRCPVCGKADSIGGRGNVVACLRCQTRWSLDGNCRVKPLNAPPSLHAAEIADLKDWHDWQVSSLPELAGAVDRGIPRLRSEGVVLSRRDGPALRRLGRGLLYLRGKGSGAELVFEGESSRAVFEASAVRGFVDNFNAFSEFDHRGQRWRLEFGGGNAAKWSFAFGRAALAGDESTRGPGRAA